MLATLLDQPGRVISRAGCWPRRVARRPAPGRPDVYIAQLRGKLGPAAAIRTVRGAGYAIDL